MIDPRISLLRGHCCTHKCVTGSNFRAERTQTKGDTTCNRTLEFQVSSYLYRTFAWHYTRSDVTFSVAMRGQNFDANESEGRKVRNLQPCKRRVNKVRKVIRGVDRVGRSDARSARKNVQSAALTDSNNHPVLLSTMRSGQWSERSFGHGEFWCWCVVTHVGFTLNVLSTESTHVARSTWGASTCCRK